MQQQSKSIAHLASPEGSRDMLTAKELEAILKISVKTIYSYVRRGLIPYVRIQSNVRFLKREIFQWIEKQSYRPSPVDGNGSKKRR
ncbi:MAG TPA: helix-turn-helix domain-containing protein [Candidatus Acidoferrales bacterium]|jgi:excisionase family DNA binding protein|nr:helix-turn-helix domain-containing protein [Candidatus Acidoferrales bacterium]